MKLLSVVIEESASCGGLLNGFEIYLRQPSEHQSVEFQPVCLIGPNGSGKSQFLQVLAEIFQCIWHACAPQEERRAVNSGLAFAIEYLVWPPVKRAPVHVRVSRGKRAQSTVVIETRADGDWRSHDVGDVRTRDLLPSRIIGYTSGENETLSLPFFTSRAGYAEEVTTRALPASRRNALESPIETAEPLEPRLMLIDYSTHLEVLVANLLLGTDRQRKALLSVAKLAALRSVRCVVQLASSSRKTRAGARGRPNRKGIQLTDELERYIEHLKSCSTCWDYESEREIYTFDYWCDEESRLAFASFFDSAFELYRALHKLALLNDLAISRPARKRFEHDVKEQRFAARLPEPPDEDKVFRFEQVTFRARGSERSVDYVSLSDGEHQFVEMLGVFAMIGERNVLFLLDEPESHFNPQWRIAFVSKLRSVATATGTRQGGADAAAQDALMTTHAPFVPCDLSRENVIIFERNNGKVIPRAPEIQTFGASFEEILEHCFRIEPPISELARTEIKQLMTSRDSRVIEAGVSRLGSSVEKVLLLDHLRSLKS